MKPVPIADYLDHIGRAFRRAWLRRAARSSPFRPRSLQAVQSAEPRPPLAFDRAANDAGAVRPPAESARSRARYDRAARCGGGEPARIARLARGGEGRGNGAQTRRGARARHARKASREGRAEAEDRHGGRARCGAEQAVLERLEFQLNEYAQLEAAIRAGFAQVEENVGAAVARILTPFLAKQAVKYVADELCKSIVRLCAGGSPGLITIRGPERVLRLLRERIADLPADVDYVEDDGVEAVVEANATPNRHRIASLGGAARLARCLSGADERDHPEIVIIKRRSALEDGHHGGAWKIAFADFMTAMMAFFLVLWIISATDKNTKTAHRPLFQSGEGGGAGEGAEGDSRRPEQDTDAPGTDSAPQRRKVALGPGRAVERDGSREPGSRGRGTKQKHRGEAGVEDAARSRPSPIRPCRRRSCSATRAPASTRSRAAAGPRESVAPKATAKWPSRRGPILRPLGSDRANRVAASGPGRTAAGGRRRTQTRARNVPNPTPGDLSSQSIQKRDSQTGAAGAGRRSTRRAHAGGSSFAADEDRAASRGNAKPASESARSRDGRGSAGRGEEAPRR